MNKRSKKHRSGIVYSTDPEFEYDYGEQEEARTLPPAQQDLRVRIEKKGRGGKVVTIVSGFTGAEDDLADLGKRLRSACGVGGSVKDREILLQGDIAAKVRDTLKKWDYRVK